jgi:hypothetical protein
VTLSDCGHQRSIIVAVEFTPSLKTKRGIQEIPDIEPVDEDVQAIRDAMRADNTLGESA